MPADDGGPKKCLFVPVSGPEGTGEYYRCLTIARAMRRRDAEIEIHFVLNRHARVERDPAFEYHLLDDTPSRAVSAVEASIRTIRPDLALFDCSGRVRHFGLVRSLGGRVVWLSDRPGKRRRGFRPAVLRRIDLHLIADPGHPLPLLGPLENALNRLFGPVPVEFVSTIVPEVARDAPVLPSGKRLERHGYAVFAPGGGGYRHAGRPVPEIFLDAAARFHEATQLPAVVVMGPQYQGEITRHSQVEVVGSLPTEPFAQLVANARLAVIGGGFMLSAQALGAGVPSVLVAVGGNDQPDRLRRYERLGITLSASLEAADMSRQAERLFSDPKRVSELGANLPAAGIRNDAGRVARRLLELASGERQ